MSGGQTGVDRGALQAAMNLVVSLGEADAVGKVQKWLGQFFEIEHPVPVVLNVAGPRESKAGGIQKRTRCFLV